MKKPLKWFGIILAGPAGLLVLAAVAVYAIIVSGNRRFAGNGRRWT